MSDSSEFAFDAETESTVASPGAVEQLPSAPVDLKSVENLSKKTRVALKAKGITSLFPIQAACFPVIFAGRDCVGKAKTGTGKTLAFVLPMIERLASLAAKRVRNDYF